MNKAHACQVLLVLFASLLLSGCGLLKVTDENRSAVCEHRRVSRGVSAYRMNDEKTRIAVECTVNDRQARPLSVTLRDRDLSIRYHWQLNGDGTADLTVERHIDSATGRGETTRAEKQAQSVFESEAGVYYDLYPQNVGVTSFLVGRDASTYNVVIEDPVNYAKYYAAFYRESGKGGGITAERPLIMEQR